jgi:succinoglycan biosynthesis transport protein ExoP
MSADSRTNSSAPFGGTPSGQLQAENTGARQITLLALLDAFRRRWIPALAIAVPACILAAALIWEILPPNYKSTAVVQVHQFEQVLAKATDKGTADFLTYRDTQTGFMKTRAVLVEALGREGVRDCRTLADIEHPVEWLDEYLEIKEDKSPEFVRISLSGEYPEDLALIVNAVKDAYMDKVVYNERNERIESLRKLKQKFADFDRQVTTNQDRIDNLARELGTGNAIIAATNQAQYQIQLRGLQEELRQINAEIRNEITAREYLRDRGLPTTSLEPIPGSAAPPTAGASTLASVPRQQLALLRRRIRQYESQLRNHNHPDLEQLRQEEADLLAVLNGQNKTEQNGPGVPISPLAWLERRRDRLQLEIEGLTEELHAVGNNSVLLNRERENIEQSKNARNSLSVKIQNKEIEFDAPQRVREIQAAHVPEQQNQKKRIQLSSLALLGTFSLIVAGFTLFEWFSHRIASTADVTHQTGMRLVGSIPSPDKGGLLGLGIFSSPVDPEEWQRAVIESMDVVRTYLLRHIDPSRPASILVTSASANEGKTTVSCQLAASLARIGRRVALVDCDFRRPSAHELVDGRPGPGLSEFLRGDVELSDICQPTQAAGLTFIAAGQVDQLTLQALSSDGGRSIIDRLKSDFDFVVIDTSPLLFVAEPSMLAQNADIVLMSTRKDYSRVPYVVQSRDSLRSLNVPLLGVVIVGADSDLQRQSDGYRQQIGHGHAIAPVLG